MNINISSKVSRDNKKVWYYIEWGRAVGQRKSAGIFTWVKPANQVQKNHNKEALILLETKRSQMILDQQSVNSTYVPQHKIKANFLDYYSDFNFSASSYAPSTMRIYVNAYMGNEGEPKASLNCHVVIHP